MPTAAWSEHKCATLLQCTPADRRVAWLHIPKAGTSFATTLVHYANASLPPNASILLEGDDAPQFKDLLDPLPRRFFDVFPIREWFRGVFWEKRGGEAVRMSGHDAMNEEAWRLYGPHHGRFFGMFRDPKSRARSLWGYFGRAYIKQNGSRSPAAYLRSVVGSQTTMVAGQRNGLECTAAGIDLLGRIFPNRIAGTPQCVDPHSPRYIRPNLALALERLKGFAFAGLTDRWADSICLFHARFGGPCLGVEFANIRPTPYEEAHMRMAEAELAGFTDPVDGALYAAVVRRFEEEWHQEGLSPQRCAQICTGRGVATTGLHHLQLSHNQPKPMLRFVVILSDQRSSSTFLLDSLTQIALPNVTVIGLDEPWSERRARQFTNDSKILDLRCIQPLRFVQSLHSRICHWDLKCVLAMKLFPNHCGAYRAIDRFAPLLVNPATRVLVLRRNESDRACSEMWARVSGDWQDSNSTGSSVTWNHSNMLRDPKQEAQRAQFERVFCNTSTMTPLQGLATFSSPPTYQHWFTDAWKILNSRKMPLLDVLNTTFEENTERHEALMQRVAALMQQGF